MSGRTHAAYVNYFQNGRKAQRLAEVERQLAGEAIQQEHQLKAEARSTENIADHFPRVIPNTPIIEWLPGYYIHRNEWEAYRDGHSLVVVKEPRQTVDPELISYQWNHFVVNSRFPWKLEDHAIVYTFV
ncbi:hypothetical protein R8O75_004751 [Klebsiella michiganensis]|uniref:hypothetical protein n=1 Tax=Enterobacteriaceae TaxID=543 RepID=UPI000666C191|nr:MULTISPECIES: hypothetical protein [Enterobacteriaceae]EMC9751511.1 hypothetical protein [Enterobacter cloacae]HBS6565008.1 hypothetical protein [Klebsiella pneumoniae]HCC5810657.1 hypothetical protein [Citrobacter freundii]ELT9752587.1 hypothetical protein [Klebsiella michiganensis]MDX7045673.1 hypothetical protein [Enterobacter hormaechei]